MKFPPLCRVVFSALVLTVFSSCNMAFHKAWRNAAARGGPGTPDASLPLKPLPAGRWDGSWHSDATGHQGRLRCVVTGPVNTSGDHVFFYHATWMGVLSGSYKTTHHVRPKGGAHLFNGEHKMPDWAGGLYRYEGAITGDTFKADYKSSADHGTYTMKRVR